MQLNHPRAGNIGYFHTSKFDSATMKSPDSDFTLDFDAIEVFNGKRVVEAEEVLRDWFNLLNAGYTLTATGNSDSHKLVSEEAGYPRNFVFLGKDDPSRSNRRRTGCGGEVAQVNREQWSFSSCSGERNPYRGRPLRKRWKTGESSSSTPKRSLGRYRPGGRLRKWRRDRKPARPGNKHDR